MSNTISKVVRNWVDQAGTDNPRWISENGVNITTGHDYRTGNRDTVYSYGYHFPMAVMMPDEEGNARGWFLVNGDGYSNSTTRHQSELRGAIGQSGLPSVIVSFDAMTRAGIDRSTVKLVHRLDDRYTWEKAEREEAPSDYEAANENGYYSTRNWQQRASDRKWTYEHQVHHLGESLIKAAYSYDVRTPGYTELNSYKRIDSTYKHVAGTAYFLSAFDHGEPGFGLYFLAQLPKGVHPATVDEAFEALKPDAVIDFEREGGEGLLRQGDVFAIPSEWETRDLPRPSKRKEYVLDVNHQVSEVRRTEGHTFGRGFIRHRPQEWGRRPEHRTVKLGDGKTWYELVKNTVPMGRAWARNGNVD